VDSRLPQTAIVQAAGRDASWALALFHARYHV